MSSGDWCKCKLAKINNHEFNDFDLNEITKRKVNSYKKLWPNNAHDMPMNIIQTIIFFLVLLFYDPT